MFRRFSINFALFSIFADMSIVLLSLSVASLLRPYLNHLSFAAELLTPQPVPDLIYPVFTAIWIGIFLLLSVYDGRRNLRAADEFTSLTLGSILAAVSQAGILYFSYRDISRLLFLVYVLIAYASMLSWRILARIAFRKGVGMGKNQPQRRVLVAGAGPVGDQVARQIKSYSFPGLVVIGFLDDDPQKQEEYEDIIGSLDDARRIIMEQDVDDVVVALPNRAYQRINDLVAHLHNLPVKVWVIPDYFGLAVNKAMVEEFGGLPMLDLRAPALNDYQRLVKRAFDLTLTFLILPLALPIMALVALLIRLEGPGPIFFRQNRVGENGRIFKMVKFRTMVPEAEELRYLVEKRDSQGHLIHKTQNDPRVTRVGKFLRRSSLDELPQIFNILKGEMSIVGPRPELPYLVDQYEPWQRKRFSVPQGVTGWWQVNGRSDKPLHLHTEEDLYYVQNYSLLLDLYILFKTVSVVIRGKGAF